VQYERNETGRVLSIGYDGDLVCDLAVCIRILRGRPSCRAEGSISGGVEEALGLLLECKLGVSGLGKTHAKTFTLTFTRASLVVRVNMNINTNKVMAIIMTRFDMPKSVMAACSTQL
jgi:hypothetical protein